ncbi:zinc-binding dehydrogenase [Streptomyces sp. SPB162]|uniref:alcohol dehydrogenase catalytic domain-containing protein n=1 Tax=Streptomyces sp. SPB162 TaxID=2940560 RepID=UPI002407407E|nr:zinc-binding dehydrogenase [Streptomyces sp. SPB162]MDF9815759.1 NADPH:quinone reductase-like Zn-dependent oxidoreductase [Streptomyces sp. SPB162]
MTKAIAFATYGDADVLRPTDVDVPDPGPGQVRVAVRAAGVNPLDAKIRSGAMSAVFPVELPHVPGLEASGTVEAVGEGVTGLAVGDAAGGPERVVTIADAQNAAVHQVRFSGGGGPGQDRTEAALAGALALHADGALQVRIAATYPLADAAEAHRASEHGHHTGKIVLTVG